MAKTKVMCVFGTRPEASKMAPVVSELRRRDDEFECVVSVSAQHREMLDDLLELFSIVPDYDLDVMRGNQSPAYVTGTVLTQLEPILIKEQPDWVLVQGDTVTTMAAAMTAFFRRIHVGHVEAGLRTNDRFQPFPEEINRRTTHLLTDLHFAPTKRAADNLLREGVPQDDVLITGNTIVDAVLDIAERPFEAKGTALEGIDLEGKRLILITAHRRESFGEPLRMACRAVADVAAAYRDNVHFVYPVHPNPNVVEAAYGELEGIPNVSLVPPVGYPVLINLIKNSYLILTDSGGIQEEAPTFGVPVLVLREVTERPEALEAGAARIVGTSRDRIVKEVSRLLDDPKERDKMSVDVNPYGDGKAGMRIVQALAERAEGL